MPHLESIIQSALGAYDTQRTFLPELLSLSTEGEVSWEAFKNPEQITEDARGQILSMLGLAKSQNLVYSSLRKVSWKGRAYQPQSQSLGNSLVSFVLPQTGSERHIGEIAHLLHLSTNGKPLLIALVQEYYPSPPGVPAQLWESWCHPVLKFKVVGKEVKSRSHVIRLSGILGHIVRCDIKIEQACYITVGLERVRCDIYIEG